MVLWIAAIYPLLVLVLSLIHLVLPQRSGLLGLSQVFAPYLFFPVVLATPFALLRGARMLRLILLMCLVLFCLRFWSDLISLPPPSNANGIQIEVLNWNVGISPPNQQMSRVRSALQADPVDVVVLEEAHWEWIQSDSILSQLYPYQLKHTHQASSGLVLLSKYPVLDHEVPEVGPGVRGWPRLIRARLDHGAGKTITIVAAHPDAPYSSGNGRCRPPTCYDPAERDRLLPGIREYVDPVLQAGQSLILAGDLNTTPYEPAYLELSAGLRDAHREVGFGFGNTWPIDRFGGRQPALLRIDHLFSSPDLAPLSISSDCTPRGSDHCILRGKFALSTP